MTPSSGHVDFDRFRVFPVQVLPGCSLLPSGAAQIPKNFREKFLRRTILFGALRADLRSLKSVPYRFLTTLASAPKGELPRMASSKKFPGEIFTPDNPVRRTSCRPLVVKICSLQIFDDACVGREGGTAKEGKPQKTTSKFVTHPKHVAWAGLDGSDQHIAMPPMDAHGFVGEIDAFDKKCQVLVLFPGHIHV